MLTYGVCVVKKLVDYGFNETEMRGIYGCFFFVQIQEILRVENLTKNMQNELNK